MIQLRPFFFPEEIREIIFDLVAQENPILAYQMAAYLRYTHIQVRLIRTIPLASIDNACRRGDLTLLRLHQLSPNPSHYTENALDHASMNGHVHVLSWWKDKSGLELKWTSNAMDCASARGHVDVLEWWKCSGLELKWTQNAMGFASSSGHVRVLDWWVNSGLELRWEYWAIYWAAEMKRTEVIQWWERSGLVQGSMDDWYPSWETVFDRWFVRSGLV